MIPFEWKKVIVICLFLSILTATAVCSQSFYEKLSAAAIELTNQRVIYDPAYYVIDYPMGDVPTDRGVCTDVVIRAYRALGLDLQELVHEDMRDHFNLYPNNWGLTRPDRNIDHRRVPNLMVFFARFGESLPITDNPRDYNPGHIVCWDLGGRAGTHIGIVVNKKSADGERYLIVHNIGRGQVVEDCLFSYHRIIGHYRLSDGSIE